MIDTPVNLIDLISAEIGPPKRVGRRPYWHCPFHEDRTPSLTLLPDGRRWKCFGACGKSGDAIDWVRERRGCSFPEALATLNAQTSVSCVVSTPTAIVPDAPKKAEAPKGKWQTQAGQIVDVCVRQLHSRAGESARVYLHNRGLKADTIREWMIGFNPRGGYLHGLFVFAGISIPWFVGEFVHSIKIRRLDSDERYACVPGSCPAGLFLGQVIVPGLPCLVVEGEFDALIGWQEARDLVNVVTLGSADRSLDLLALEQLLPSPRVHLCYDSDQAGKRGAGRWDGLSARLRVCPLPKGKDLNEFFLLGGDVRKWVGSVLYGNSTQPTLHPTLSHNGQPDNDLRVGLGTLRHPTPDAGIASCSTTLKEGAPC